MAYGINSVSLGKDRGKGKLPGLEETLCIYIYIYIYIYLHDLYMCMVAKTIAILVCIIMEKKCNFSELTVYALRCVMLPHCVVIERVHCSFFVVLELNSWQLC